MTGVPDNDPTVGAAAWSSASSAPSTASTCRATCTSPPTPRQERGAGHAHRSRSRSLRRCARGWSSSAGRGPATRAIPRPASARPTAPRRRPTSPGPSKSTARTAHSFNANRISLSDPEAGRDRALDLHQRRRRLGPSDPPAFRGRHHHEPRAARPSRQPRTWCARTSGGCARRARVQFQIQFGEYGGSYVNHCHNTVHEDFAMLMRIQLLRQSRHAAGGRDAHAESDAATASPSPRRKSCPKAIRSTTAIGQCSALEVRPRMRSECVAWRPRLAIEPRWRIACVRDWPVCALAAGRRQARAGARTTCPTCPSSPRTARPSISTTI